MTENNSFQNRNDLCRLCSSRSSLVSVFNGRFGMKENMAEVVEVTSGIKISPNDGVSHMLCSSCVHLSITFFKVRNNSMRNDKELKDKGIEKKSIHQSVKDLVKQDPKLILPSSIYGCNISPVVLIQKNITNNLKQSKIESLKRKKSCDQEQMIHTNNDQIIGNISKKFKSMDSASTSGLTTSQTPEQQVVEIFSSDNEQGVHSGCRDPIGEKELDQKTTLPFSIKPLTKALFICEVCNKVLHNTIEFKKHKTTHMHCSLCRTTFRSIDETKKHEESCTIMKIMNNQPKLIVKRCDEIEDVREKYLSAFQKLIIEFSDDEDESDNNSETTFSNENDNSNNKNSTESNERYIVELPYPEKCKDNRGLEVFKEKYDLGRSEQSNVKKPMNKESETSLRKSISGNCKKIPEISGKLNNPQNSQDGKSKEIDKREICGEKYNTKNSKTVYNIGEFENPCNFGVPSKGTTEIIKQTASENIELISLLDDLETDPKDKRSEDSHETHKPENSEIESNFEDSTKISPLKKSQNVSDVKENTRKSEESDSILNNKELATVKTRELYFKGIEKKSIHQSVKDLVKQDPKLILPSSIYGCNISPVVLIQKNITNNLKQSKIESLKRKKSCDQEQMIHTNNDQIIGNISKKFKSMDSASTSGLTTSQTPEQQVVEIFSSDNEQGVHSGCRDPIGEKELDQKTTLPFSIKPLTKALFICEVCNKVLHNTIEFKKHKTTHMHCSLCRTSIRSMDETKKHEESCTIMKIMNNQPKLIVKRCDEIEDVREKYLSAFQKLIIEISDDEDESDNKSETTFSNENDNSNNKNSTESNERYIVELPYPEKCKDNRGLEVFKEKYDLGRSEQSNVKKNKNKESETSLRKSISGNCKKIPEISGKLNNPQNSQVGKSKEIDKREICGEKYNTKNSKTVYNIGEFENPCNFGVPSEGTTEIIKQTASENIELISLLDDLETDPKDKRSEDSHETHKPENSEIESNFEDSTKISPLKKSQTVSDVKENTRKSEESDNILNNKELATVNTRELYFNESRISCNEISISHNVGSEEIVNIDKTSQSLSHKNSCENIKKNEPKKKKFPEEGKINEHSKDSKKLKVKPMATTVNDKKEMNDQHKEPIIISNPDKPTATTVDNKRDMNNQQEGELCVSFDNKNSNLTNEHADNAPLKISNLSESNASAIDTNNPKNVFLPVNYLTNTSRTNEREKILQNQPVNLLNSMIEQNNIPSNTETISKSKECSNQGLNQLDRNGLISISKSNFIPVNNGSISTLIAPQMVTLRNPTLSSNASIPLVYFSSNNLFLNITNNSNSVGMVTTPLTMITSTPTHARDARTISTPYVLSNDRTYSSGNVSRPNLGFESQVSSTLRLPPPMRRIRFPTQTRTTSVQTSAALETLHATTIQGTTGIPPNGQVMMPSTNATQRHGDQVFDTRPGLISNPETNVRLIIPRVVGSNCEVFTSTAPTNDKQNVQGNDAISSKPETSFCLGVKNIEKLMRRLPPPMRRIRFPTQTRTTSVQTSAALETLHATTIQGTTGIPPNGQVMMPSTNATQRHGDQVFDTRPGLISNPETNVRLIIPRVVGSNCEVFTSTAPTNDKQNVQGNDAISSKPETSFCLGVKNIEKLM